MFDKQCCYKGGQKHHFVGRYSEESIPTITEIGPSRGFTAWDMQQIIRASSHTKSQYKGDVCTWCGKVVNANIPTVS